MKFTLNTFSGGLNTLFDPRVIAPNQEGEPAESPDMENMEVTSKGSLITSTGFEIVSSGAGSSGVLNLISYEKDPTTAYLVITLEDNDYYITPANSTWTLIGDYGDIASNVGGVVFKGTSSIRRVILGNDISANTTKKWDGTTFASLTDNPPDGWIMESFQGRLFIAGLDSATLYYSEVENEDDWSGGTISFPDIITGLKAEGEFLQVHTKRESFVVQFYYNDSFTLSSPLKKPYKNTSGCLAHKTIQSVYNDSYHLSVDGVQKFGADPNYLNQPLRTNSLSWKINPSLIQSKLNMDNIEKACAVFFDKKYLCAVPYGDDTYPSKIFQYNWLYDCWTVRSGFFPSGFAIFPSSENRDELFFSSALGPQLYKFNKFWSYDGVGYEKFWTSKIFNFGSSVVQKQLNYIDIAGAMFANTTFYVDVVVDGVTVTFEVNSDNLLQSTSGGYYGDSYYGDVYGGGEASTFYRYGARLPFPQAITQGRELQVTFRNQAAGEPFAIDWLQIDFEPLDSVQIPEAVQVISVV